MFKVIIHASDLKRNFDYFKDNADFFVCPKDRNFPYIKNGKVIQFNRINSTYYEHDAFKFKEFNEKTMKLYSPFTNIGLIFKFETEEDSFYFKMKYC